MLTSDQEKWINHLSDDSKIKIIPFDPTSGEKFEKIKSIIQSKFEKDTEVQHRGATSFRISGQDEIDVYIPVQEKYFNDYLPPLNELFGEPRSNHQLERVRFATSIDEKHIDIFLINKEKFNWLNLVKFENHLRNNPEVLKEYEKLKESGNGLSVREYYRRKIEFINSVLSRFNTPGI